MRPASARRRFRLFRSPFDRSPDQDGSSFHYLRALLEIVKTRNKRPLMLAPFITWLLFPFLCVSSGHGAIWTDHLIPWILLGVPVSIRVASVQVDPILPSPRVISWHRKVYPSELAGMLTLSDPLTRAYLELLKAVVAMPAVTVADGDAIRRAIQLIGASIWDLFETLADDLDIRAGRDYPDMLRREAARLTAEADEEADAVTARSLRRQAVEIASQVELAERQVPLYRRMEVLRQEIVGYIATLRARCELYQAGDVPFREDVERLTANIRDAATDANRIAETKDYDWMWEHELDGSLMEQQDVQQLQASE